MTTLTPAKVRALCSAHGIQPKKSLGQNFLVDGNVARRIASLAELGDDTGSATGARVLEIGPGLGSLTLALCDQGAQVVAVELDARLAGVLAEVLTEAGVADQVQVVVADALDADLESLVGGRRRARHRHLCVEPALQRGRARRDAPPRGRARGRATSW